MTNRVVESRVEYALGLLGWFLVLLVTGLAERGYSAQRSVSGRAGAFLARRTIDGVAAIGWLVDRLPPPAERFHGTAHVARPV
jgi:hypothetical protein